MTPVGRWGLTNTSCLGLTWVLNFVGYTSQEYLNQKQTLNGYFLKKHLSHFPSIGAACIMHSKYLQFLKLNCKKCSWTFLLHYAQYACTLCKRTPWTILQFSMCDISIFGVKMAKHTILESIFFRSLSCGWRPPHTLFPPHLPRTRTHTFETLCHVVCIFFLSHALPLPFYHDKRFFQGLVSWMQTEA